MYKLKIPKTLNTSAILIIMAAACALWGCEGAFRTDQKPTPQQVADMLEPNVNGVIAFYNGINPFLWTEDVSAPLGIAINALYLVGPEGTGVFGDGIIRPKMYAAERRPDGTREWKLIKEWAYDVEQAKGFRSTKKTTGGWGYRLHLAWGDLDLCGREIRLVVSFERNIDGIVVPSRKKDFRVPRRGT